MFELADNEKIGLYLLKKIKERFKSQRQFCKAYIETQGREADNEEMRKMSNRLSQIIRGRKAIQIHDLPLFTKLLNVSCEEILSAGKSHVPVSNHLTNYAVAFSKDEQEWKDYVHREDKLILNADEYGKTVIDYALEFENYDFLKFLMNKKYIWFVGTDEKKYYYNFGAGTSIERNSLLFTNINVLDGRLKERFELRMRMIVLAIEHGDIEVLTELHAREIPSLYDACYFACTPADCDKYYDRDMLEALANASDVILEYFSREFEITDRIGKKNKFVFPFVGELIEMLLQNKNDYAEWLLKDAIAHNQYAYDKLTQLLATTVNFYNQEYLKCESLKSDIIKRIMRELDFYDNGNLVSYRDVGAKDGIITNIIQINATSSNVKIKRLIQEVNELYHKIHNIEPIIRLEA